MQQLRTIRQGKCMAARPRTFARKCSTLSFADGPEHQRIRQTVDLTSNAPSHMEAGTTWYLNGENSQGLSYEKEIKANGTIEHKHYVNAGGMSFALYVKREGTLNGKPATSISYFHQDHLGSIAVISNELGVVTERLAYDPWGRRRNVDGQTDVNDALYGVNTDRGYTMHEHLDEMGIIHMNGRIYDPLAGRFMSADPFIQAPGNLQSYNRYAYVLNNPLAYTDPSGNFWQYAIYVIIGAEVAYQVGLIEKDFARMIQGIAAAAGTGNWAWAAGFSPVAAGAMGGFAGSFVGSGGDLEAGLRGGLTGVMFGYVGGKFGAGSFGSYAGHAVTGCVSAVAGGGKCGTGAASALFGKFTSNQIAGWGGGSDTMDWVVARGVATSVAGGIGSELAGGKFANGAVTAAYGYLFNQMSDVYVRGSSQCSSATSCTASVYDEKFHYTGNTREAWSDVDWTGPNSHEISIPSPKKLSERIPGLDVTIRIGAQQGELQHEVKVDRYYFEITIDKNIQIGRVPGSVVNTNETRWVSDPSGKYILQRPQIQSCVNGVCAEWR